MDQNIQQDRNEMLMRALHEIAYWVAAENTHYPTEDGGVERIYSGSDCMESIGGIIKGLGIPMPETLPLDAACITNPRYFHLRERAIKEGWTTMSVTSDEWMREAQSNV